MALLSTLLGARTADTADRAVGDSGLEQGQIYVFTPAGIESFYDGDICWQAPGNGEVTIEIWGAGGSGARGRCCGMGIPGNSGAYSRKRITVEQGSYICGTVGASCDNASTSCFRGCSESTCICWVGKNLDGCMCAEGGVGGIAQCSTGTSPYCCFVGRCDGSYLNAGYCFTSYDNCCGLICNWTQCHARGFAYGGDVNRCGTISCATFMNCRANCHCCSQYHVAVAPGIMADEGAVLAYQGEGNVAHGCYTGNGIHSVLHGLAVAGKNPVRGGLYVNGCWSGANRLCGCYNDHGCLNWMPTGMGGIGQQPMPNVQDKGGRGGHGALRIKFIGTN